MYIIFSDFEKLNFSLQVEGKGNGIKTVVVNMVEVAKALNRPPTCKFNLSFCIDFDSRVKILKLVEIRDLNNLHFQILLFLYYSSLDFMYIVNMYGKLTHIYINIFKRKKICISKALKCRFCGLKA